MKNLLQVWLFIRHVGVTSTKGSIVGHNNKLVHVAVKSQRHLIKCPNVLIERWNGEYIRLVSKNRCHTVQAAYCLICLLQKMLKPTQTQRWIRGERRRNK